MTTKKMTKDQRALTKILDALDGLDQQRIRKVLRAVAIFHEIDLSEIRYVPSAPIVVERPWRRWTLTPVWNSGGNVSSGTTSDARWHVTNHLLDASNEAAQE